MRRKAIIIAAFLAVGLIQTVHPAQANSADSRNPEGSRGITVDDLGRGVKSAAQNIEREIPKMGSAIGGAFKKLTEKGSGKPSQEPARQKQ